MLLLALCSNVRTWCVPPLPASRVSADPKSASFTKYDKCSTPPTDTAASAKTSTWGIDERTDERTGERENRHENSEGMDERTDEGMDERTDENG